MNVTDVLLENMVLQAGKGIEMQEATNVRFKNIQVLAAENNPVIDLVQSQQIIFDNISVKKDAGLLLHAGGDRVKEIKLVNSAAAGIKEMLVADMGADAKEIKLNN